MNSGLQMLQHAKGAGAKIDASVLLHDVALPGLADDLTGRIPVRLVIAQSIARGEQRSARRRASKETWWSLTERYCPRELLVIGIIGRSD